MLHRYSEVLNLPVICAEDGSKAGIVKDILFSIGERQAKALLLEQRGMTVRRRVVFLDELLSIGGGAVIVGSYASVTDMDRASFKNAFGDEGGLLGTKVYSKAGGEVGVIKDVVFDLRTGRIEGFEISDGLLQDVIRGRKLLPLAGKVEFGEEFAVVDTEAVEEMKETGGGIKNRLLGK
ncbi:MAG: PRC-barrel domain-containing protein [Acetivibrionales bacterium]|jgi:uncharacterized protein YrrD